jgi:hypothetical protein
MTKTTTIEKLAKNVSEFHPYVLIPFSKTSMTIPAVLFYSIATKHQNPRNYFKETAFRIKNEILLAGIDSDQLVGKLSRKVQEVSWCEIIHNAKENELSLTDFSSAKVIPYDNTTMTIPMFLYNQILRRQNGTKREATKYIKQRAEEIKNEILKNSSLTPSELKGKISHKIQENLWLEFIPDRIKNAPINLVA